ncbi:hypothetical protein V8C86DRAFT_2753333 [Haematococcus lacustris]
MALVAPSITDAPVPTWDDQQLEAWSDVKGMTGTSLEECYTGPYDLTFSKFNPTPGTGRTGLTAVPPNPYPFYSETERYLPILQGDGGQLSEWQPMYNPSKEQADADREAAFASGVPHGYVALGTQPPSGSQLELWVVSELHSEDEYGAQVDPSTGQHSGGAFKIKVDAGIRIEALRNVIRDEGGIIPALQKLSYAGKHLDDSQRTLAHYGVAYWHARFPHWPIKIRRF